ncbi:MAG TPA: YcxB family protein [Ruminiclostridium sp.]|nr:YcxB family protein [Ruminiclostridium sp.]
MEPLIENKCKHSKANLLEMAKGSRSTVHIIICIAIIIYCIGTAICCILRNCFPGILVSFLLTAFFAFLYLFLPYKNVNKMIKRCYELYHAEVESNLCFFEDYILNVNKQTNGETKTDYNQIIKVSQTKNLYLMNLREQIVILVDKNGFVKGNKDDFKRLIKEKAVHAKIRL